MSRGLHESRRPVFADLRQRPVASSSAAHALTAGNLQTRCGCGILRCAFQRDDREVPPATDEIDLECESIAGLSGD